MACTVTRSRTLPSSSRPSRLSSSKRPGLQQAQADQAAARAQAQQAAGQASSDDRIAKIKELGDMKAQGLLSEDEFAAEKARVLAS